MLARGPTKSKSRPSPSFNSLITISSCWQALKTLSASTRDIRYKTILFLFIFRCFWSLVYHFNLYPTVGCTALFAIVGCDGSLKAVAGRLNAIRSNTLHFEITLNTLGTLTRKAIIDRSRTHIIGMSAYFNAYLGVFIQQARQLIEFRIRFGTQSGLTGIKQNIFRSEERRVGTVCRLRWWSAS